MTGLRKVRLYSKLFFKKSKKYWNCSFGKFIFSDKLHSTETQEGQDKLIKFYVGEKRMFSFFSSFVMIVFEKHREMND